MHSVLAFEESVGIFAALDGHRDTLDAHFLARLHIGYRHLISLSLSPPCVHTHEHLGPILCFGTAGARVYLHHRVHGVLLLAQHILQFEVLDGFDSLVVVGVNLLFADEILFIIVESKLQLIGKGTYILVAFYPFLYALDLLHLHLGGLGVVPEVRVLGAELLLFEFHFPFVDIKITLERVGALQDVFQLV